VPSIVPVFSMSTVPVCAGAPGFRLDGLKMAAPPRLLSMVRLPAVNVFAGFADSAVKSAPDPTATPTAASAVASAAVVRLGRLTSWDMGTSPSEVVWARAQGAGPCRDRS
jgi:hypothetical protein